MCKKINVTCIDAQENIKTVTWLLCILLHHMMMMTWPLSLPVPKGNNVAAHATIELNCTAFNLSKRRRRGFIHTGPACASIE